MYHLVSVYLSPYQKFSCAYTMPYVSFAFTLRLFLSHASCHSITLLCNSYSVSVSIPKSSAYSSSHNSSFLTLSLNTSIPLLIVTGNSTDTPHYVLTRAVVPLYISSTKLTIGAGTPSSLGTECHFSVHSNAFSKSKKAQYIGGCFDLTFSLGMASQSIWHMLFTFLS